MKEVITITSKGQTTIPSQIRKKLGVSEKGGVLQIQFDEKKGELLITRPASIAEISQRLSKYIKPGTTPLTDVDKLYQQRSYKGAQ